MKGGPQLPLYERTSNGPHALRHEITHEEGKYERGKSYAAP